VHQDYLAGHCPYEGKDSSDPHLATHYIPKKWRCNNCKHVAGLRLNDCPAGCCRYFAAGSCDYTDRHVGKPCPLHHIKLEAALFFSTFPTELKVVEKIKAGEMRVPLNKLPPLLVSAAPSVVCCTRCLIFSNERFHLCSICVSIFTVQTRRLHACTNCRSDSHTFGNCPQPCAFNKRMCLATAFARFVSSSRRIRSLYFSTQSVNVAMKTSVHYNTAMRNRSGYLGRLLKTKRSAKSRTKFHRLHRQHHGVFAHRRHL